MLDISKQKVTYAAGSLKIKNELESPSFHYIRLESEENLIELKKEPDLIDFREISNEFVLRLSGDSGIITANFSLVGGKFFKFLGEKKYGNFELQTKHAKFIGKMRKFLDDKIVNLDSFMKSLFTFSQMTRDEILVFRKLESEILLFDADDTKKGNYGEYSGVDDIYYDETLRLRNSIDEIEELKDFDDVVKMVIAKTLTSIQLPLSETDYSLRQPQTPHYLYSEFCNHFLG